MSDNNNVIYRPEEKLLEDLEYADFKMRLSHTLYEIKRHHYELTEYLEKNEMVSLLELQRMDFKDKYISLLKQLKEITGMVGFESILLITRNLNDETYLRNWFEENKNNKDIVNAVVGSTTQKD